MSIVEFDVIKGPKGLQASRVTGPNGAPVRGDPYSRMRARTNPPAAPMPIPRTTTPAASNFYTYYPANFSQIPGFTGQPTQQSSFSPFPFQATPQQSAGFVLPAANSAMSGSRNVIGGSQVPPMFFAGAPHVQQGLSSGYDPFSRQTLGHMYESPGPGQQNISQPVCPTIQQPAPTFPQVSRQDSGTSQIGSTFAKFPE
ncbi:hypothetical protein FBU59_002458 [Linderina macrospora]|uniref:Uncharacterized protein n=1 Tax=Linderina macrospora TaxID=4868 RepID=A0ACC1JB29_9FUNG|nr:hypothetical protein FBU59_002458 [Linderina macrospora]